jgi:hypothetical protein
LQNICNNQKIYPKFVISTLSIWEDILREEKKHLEILR